MARLEKQMLELLGLPFVTKDSKESAMQRLKSEAKDIQHRYDNLIVD